MEITEIKKIGKGKRYYLFVNGNNEGDFESEVLAKYKLKTPSSTAFSTNGLSKLHAQQMCVAFLYSFFNSPNASLISPSVLHAKRKP